MLNRYTVEKPYRGFESLRHRQIPDNVIRLWTNFRFAPGTDIGATGRALICALHGGEFLQGVSERGSRGKVRCVVGIQLYDVGD